MASRYAPIWTQLKKDKKVVIKCRKEKAATLVQAVKKQKAKENAPRKALELPSFGHLQYKVKELVKGMAEITFTLVIANRAEDF